MTHKLIHTENYLLAVVDDRKRGWFYCVRTKSFFHDEGEDVLCCNGDLSVEAHLPLNSVVIIENLPLLPPLEQEDDVDELANEYGEDIGNKNGTAAFDYKRGYNKTKEKYSLSNIIDLYIEETRCGMDMWSKEENEVMTTIGKIIQSLSQPKMPVGFECEESVFFATNAFSSDITLTSEGLQDTVLKGIKTTTNSQGQTQWVGKYIY